MAYVIAIRFANIDRIALLQRSVTSALAQKDVNVRVVIAVQNFTDGEVARVKDALSEIEAIFGNSVTIIQYQTPVKGDHRAAMLNFLLDHATSDSSNRYIQYLDYDDILFSHAARSLSDAMEADEAPFAFGTILACDVALYGDVIRNVSIVDYFEARKYSRIDLFSSNFLPLHAYAFDLAELAKSGCRYDESFDRHEARDLLMRFLARRNISYRAAKIEIGLYNFFKSRERVDTTVSIFEEDSNNPEQWSEPLDKIFHKNRNLVIENFMSDHVGRN